MGIESIKNIILNKVKLIKDSIGNMFSEDEVIYIVENKQWSIKEDGEILKKYASKKIRLSTSPFMVRNKVVHYGSINCFYTGKNFKVAHKSNKIIVNWFHISHENIKSTLIKKMNKCVDIWYTSCSHTSNKLIKIGIDRNKIRVIPIPYDHNIFNSNKEERKVIRKILGFNDSDFVIGSFQKDGNGWGEGFEPKYIKGPDILVGQLKKINQEICNVKVLLLGPARGFVKKEFEKNKIDYRHLYVDDTKEVSKMYKALDLYLVCSREEGGPKALLESLASGVPLITTNVGMAPDLNDGKSLIMVNDYDEISRNAKNIYVNKNFKKKLIENGIQHAEKFSIKNLINEYEGLWSR